MPYYRKGSLADEIKNITTQTGIISFLYQITMAFLAFDKHAGCWHLDLKPDNILVKAEGEYLICDFGCAKLVDSLNVSRLPITHVRGAGTTRYAAPEVIMDFVGGKYSDVWSLGVILYEILYDGDHPLMNISKNYPDTIGKFLEGLVKINFPPKPGF